MRVHRWVQLAWWPLFCLAGAGAADLESERRRCIRPKGAPGVRKPGDLNTTFGPLLSGEAFQEYGPKVLSTDPWVIYFDNLLSEDEVQALEANMFDHEEQVKSFMSSAAGGQTATQHSSRFSETAFCLPGRCDDHWSVQSLRARASKITKVPPDNFDLSQALRYKEGMFYKTHHDNHPTFNYLPCGSRIFTYFVYLSDAGLEGGATFFPALNLRAPAKRGAAVLFANTLDSSPMRTDLRTQHESETVTKGEKRGINMWLYQYNYRAAWRNGCTSIELADNLGHQLRKAASAANPKVVFQNNAKKPFNVFLVEDRGPERFLGTVDPGSDLTLESAEGVLLHVYDEKRKLVAKRHVLSNSLQRINLGKKRKGDEL